MEPDETRFLMRLGMKAPLLDDLPDDVVDRFRGCEPIIGVDSGGECLVLCAHLLGVAISLRLQPEVDCDRLLVRFREMTAQLQIEDVEETIDNLARETHAAVILARHRRQLVGNLSFSNLWSKRAAAFPHLRFGLDVEANLQCLNPALVGPVVKRLDELNEAAEEWPRIATPAPRWRSKVSPESERVMKNALLKSFRVFKSADGQSTLFEWHARFGSSHRIHLRFDREVFAVEIGYIGLHLPLA